HPESIVHSMVQFQDSSVIAQLGCPDMRVPIQYALSYPSRLDSDFERLDLFKIASLNFQRPDLDVFPCLDLAYRALREGGTSATVLNAANEVLVEYFLNDKIGFYDIPKYIEMAMNEHDFIDQPSLKDIINIDAWTRSYIKNIIN
ncbi:MAG: 1-deoxy-D-xylulose-5-phosphate reductoisomerase, partial [Peptostreptococcus sp.]|nr:1-deoxy-D-xylulose-5-phosphate reductoisomerase [Peptostreptococcus sp.]